MSVIPFPNTPSIPVVNPDPSVFFGAKKKLFGDDDVVFCRPVFAGERSIANFVHFLESEYFFHLDEPGGVPQWLREDLARGRRLLRLARSREQREQMARSA